MVRTASHRPEPHLPAGSGEVPQEFGRLLRSGGGAGRPEAVGSDEGGDGAAQRTQEVDAGAGGRRPRVWRQQEERI